MRVKALATRNDRDIRESVGVEKSLTISNAQFIRVAEHSPLESRLEIIGAVHLVVGALGALLRVHLLDAKCNLRRCSLKDVIRL